MTEDVEKAISQSEALSEVGSTGAVSGMQTSGLGFRQDEFLPRLRGSHAIKTYREMKDNDPVIGATLMAMDMMLRRVEWHVEPVSDAPEAQEAAEFVDSVLIDMSHTFESFISEVLSFLPFGWSFFEKVYKRRLGPDQSDGSRRSQFNDGKIGIRKLAPRAQWTLRRFIMSEDGGIEAFVQEGRSSTSEVVIPMEKGLLFRTTTVNDDPTGRSVLRNAYTPWYMMSAVQNVEGTAIERELNGLPVARIPKEYLARNATPEQKAFVASITRTVRDIKLNSQGSLVLPSDPWVDADGKPTNLRLVDIELIASQGTRAIDTGAVITRYQQDIARSVLADFLTLGQNERGSFALSKSKTDLFLTSLEAYRDNIASILNRYLVTQLWRLNGFNIDLMPELVPGGVAPVDLAELGEYVQRISGAGASLFPDLELNNELRRAASLPEAEDDPDIMGVAATPQQIEDDAE